MQREGKRCSDSESFRPRPVPLPRRSPSQHSIRPLGDGRYGLRFDHRMFDAPLELICLGEFTPNLGDAGGIGAG